MNQDHAARLIARLLALRYLPREDKEVRRLLVADLRPLIADTVDLRIAAHPPSTPHTGIAFAGPATVAGPLVGGDAGTVTNAERGTRTAE